MAIQEYNYQTVHEETLDSKPILSADDISLIADLEVKVEVVIGSASLSLEELYNLKHGSVIKLDQRLEAPVDICLNGNVIARGTLCIVDDNYAIKITQSLNDN